MTKLFKNGSPASYCLMGAEEWPSKGAGSVIQGELRRAVTADRLPGGT